MKSITYVLSLVILALCIGFFVATLNLMNTGLPVIGATLMTFSIMATAGAAALVYRATVRLCRSATSSNAIPL